MIHIIAPDIWQKDAVGNFCLNLSELLIDNNLQVKLYAQNYNKEETPHINHMDFLFENIKDDDVIFLSYSIYESYLEQIIALPNKKICYFHGVTPPSLLEKFEPVTADLCRKSQKQFSLLSKFDILMANSKFIANDLKKYVGDKKYIEVTPPVFNTRFLFKEKCSNIKVKNRTINFLYVGRIVPHKKIEETIVVFGELKKYFSDAKLIIIGDAPNVVYSKFLDDKVSSMNFSKDSVLFTGKIDDKQLYKYYCTSDIFITMSEHEGFCIPVLEAIFFGMPIILKGGNAAEEVAGNYGFVINDKAMIIDIVKLLKDTEKKLFLKNNGPLYVDKLLSKNTKEFWLTKIEKLKS